MNIKKRLQETGSSFWMLLIVFTCFLLFGIGCTPPAPEKPLPESPEGAIQDAFKYQRDGSGITDFIYNQLWYFNFLDDRGDMDPSNDIAGVAAYGLANPENLLSRLPGFQKGVVVSFGMIIRDPSEGKSFMLESPRWDPAEEGNLIASKTFEPGPGPELKTPGGTMDVISPDEYHIVGHAMKEDREFKWDLTYKRGLGGSWRTWVNWPMPYTFKVIPAWIDYYMHMPNAVVSGTFYVRDGKEEATYTLKDVKGYHDGFASEFVFSIIEWDWMDYKQDNISVHLLHPHEPVYKCKGEWAMCLPGNLRVHYNGKDYDFIRHRDSIEIIYEKYGHNDEYNVDYPVEETIIAKDADGNRLEIHWKMLRHVIVYYDVPAPFNDNVSFEMVSEFTGTFYDAATGTTVPMSGMGWSDWSGPAFPKK